MAGSRRTLTGSTTTPARSSSRRRRRSGRPRDSTRWMARSRRRSASSCSRRGWRGRRSCRTRRTCAGRRCGFASPGFAVDAGCTTSTWTTAWCPSCSWGTRHIRRTSRSDRAPSWLSRMRWRSMRPLRRAVTSASPSPATRRSVRWRCSSCRTPRATPRSGSSTWRATLRSSPSNSRTRCSRDPSGSRTRTCACATRRTSPHSRRGLAIARARRRHRSRRQRRALPKPRMPRRWTLLMRTPVATGHRCSRRTRYVA